MDFAHWLWTLQLSKVHFMQWPWITTADDLTWSMELHHHKEGLHFTDTMGFLSTSSPEHCFHVTSQIKAFK